jgi:hypothetical protein
MIDTRRWVLVEAWLSLGLRVQWAPSYLAVERDSWQRDDEERVDYVYEGGGLWYVLQPERMSLGFSPPTSPQLGVLTLLHELAHYLVSSEDARAHRNFGLTGQDNDGEARALEAESVIHAMAVACGRIASLALAGRV